MQVYGVSAKTFLWHSRSSWTGADPLSTSSSPHSFFPSMLQPHDRSQYLTRPWSFKAPCLCMSYFLPLHLENCNSSWKALSQVHPSLGSFPLHPGGSDLSCIWMSTTLYHIPLQQLPHISATLQLSVSAPHCLKNSN